MRSIVSLGLSMAILAMAIPGKAADNQSLSETKIQHLQHQGLNSTIATHAYSGKPSPFDLVFSAYQGQYHRQGIPGFGSFIESIAAGKITPSSLVEAAIQAQVYPRK